MQQEHFPVKAEARLSYYTRKKACTEAETRDFPASDKGRAFALDVAPPAYPGMIFFN